MKAGIDRDSFQNALVSLYAEFTADLIAAEQAGKGHYSDEDFGFEQFMTWLRVNNP